ncbi:TPA: hypothetical protein DDW35_09500 [Candidatus Sumerlaeota bacterium]|nr:hypothetical protein [Candidatus Sumerlaeota bacterium]
MTDKFLRNITRFDCIGTILLFFFAPHCDNFTKLTACQAISARALKCSSISKVNTSLTSHAGIFMVLFTLQLKCGTQGVILENECGSAS